MMPITVSHLRHAITLAKQGNFHQAAERLQISQAGLSRSIQSLEAGLGVKLFDRLGSGTEPTTLGRLVVERGATIVSDLDDLEREVRLTMGLETGSLTVGAGPYPMALAVMPSLARLLADKPQLKVRAKQHDWLSVTTAVLRHDVDIAIAEVSHAKEFDQLETKIIGEHQLYFFARSGHDLFEASSVSFDDLVRYPIVGTPVPERVAPHFRREKATTYRSSPGSVLRPSVEVDDLQDGITIVTRSDVLLVSPFSIVSDALDRGLLRAIPVVVDWFRLSYGLIYIRHRSLSPSARIFVDLVKTIESETRQREIELAKAWLPTLHE